MGVLRKGGFYSLLKNFSKLGLTTFSFIFLVRILPKEDFGLWVTFMTLRAIIEMARAGLIKTGVTKFYHQAENELQQKKFMTAGYLVNIFFSIFFIISISFSEPLVLKIYGNSELYLLLMLYAIILLIETPYHYYQYLLETHLEFQKCFILTLVRQSIFLAYLFIVFIYKIDTTLSDLIYIQIAALFIAFIVSIYFGRRHLNLIFKPVKHEIIIFWNYSKYVVGVSISSMLLKSIDKLMIGSMLSFAMVAIYDVAVRVTTIVESPATALGNVFFPLAMKNNLMDKPNEVNEFYEKSVSILISIVYPIIILVFIVAEPIVVILAGEDYRDSYLILRYVILIALFIPFNKQFGITMNVIGRPRINFYLTLIGACVNVVLNIVLIKQFDIYGAVFATLLTSLTIFIIGQYYLVSHLQISHNRIIKNILLNYTNWTVELKRISFKFLKLD